MKKILIIVSILLVFPASAILAQEGISSTVEVKREFEGKLLEISKSKLDAKYSDTLTKLNLKFDYSIFDRPIKDLYEFSPMQSAHLNREGLVRYPVLYAKIAASYPWMPEADIYVQPRLGDKFSMVAYGNHHSYWGHRDTAVDGTDALNRMVNKGGLDFSYVWKRGEITAGGYYSHNLYYFDEPDKQNAFQNIGANLRVRSTKPEPTVFYYDANIKYLGTKADLGFPINGISTINEDRIDLDGAFGVAIKHKHKVLLGIRSNNAFFTFNFNPFFNEDNVAGNYEFVPHYKYESGRWRLKAGLAIAGNYYKDRSTGESIVDTASRIAHVYPDVYAGFEAAKNSLWIYAKADGNNTLSTASYILKQNPWMGTPYYGSLSTSIRVELGLNGVVRDLFSYSVSGSYSHYSNYLSFESTCMMLTPAILHNLDAINVKAEALFKSKVFQGGASGKYTYFFDQTKIPTMIPSFIVNVFGKYNYRQRLFFEVNLQYYSSMKGYEGAYFRIPGFVDLGARFTFAINSKFSVFAQGQNLINQKITYVQNYLEPGMNFGLGLYLKL